MKYYRKQPVEAIQWNGDNQMEVSDFIQKVTKSFATKDDGYGNLNVCYMDSKKRTHQAIIPKFGWVVVEGKTLQFYKDETFRKTFKPVAESASEAVWPDMHDLIDKLDKAFEDCMFKGFYGISKEKIQEMVNKKASEDEGSKPEPSVLDLARQADKVSFKRLMEIIDKDFEDNYQAMLDKWLETLPFDANELQKYAVNEKDVESDTFDSVLDEMKELHAKKNKDYKGSFHDLFKEYGMPYALGHLEEKLNRVKAITENGGNAVKNDHIEDSVIDLASYAVMLYVELKNKEK